jgi:formate hydrogenlyase transcriptional activator
MPQKAARKFRTISKKSLELFETYDWPGNIRELQNVIERAVVLCDSETFSIDDTWLKREENPVVSTAVLLSATLSDRERALIEAALAESRAAASQVDAAAAVKLGIPRQTPESKILSLESTSVDSGRSRTRLTDQASLPFPACAQKLTRNEIRLL